VKFRKTRIYGLLSAIAIAALLLVPTSGVATADPVTKCRPVYVLWTDREDPNNLLCITIDNFTDHHTTTVWFDHKGVGGDRWVHLAYYGIYNERHDDIAPFMIHYGDLRGMRWEWGHRSPAGCYRPVLAQWNGSTWVYMSWNQAYGAACVT
jgi:hypothetical protein